MGDFADPDVVTRRILALHEALGHLAASGAKDATLLAQSPMLRAATERWLQIAVEACIDIAYHLISANEWTPPETARSAFLALASHGLIGEDLARRLSTAAGLRNILVHDYVSVDLERLARIVREDLDDLRAFGAAMSPLLGT